MVYRVLVKDDFLSAKMLWGPLSQSPLLQDLCWLLKLHEFTGNIAIEDSKLGTQFCTLKDCWWSPSKSS